MFGSGTYGFEIEDCEEVIFEDCAVEKCTFGIGRILESRHAVFKNCDFIDNEQFDLIEFNGACSFVKFVDCSFTSNRSCGTFIAFRHVERSRPVLFDGCVFKQNAVEVFTARPDLVEFKSCTFEENQFPNP
jgi:hypothetical protein